MSSIKKVINQLEKKYPISLAEEWDNVGLLIGRDDKEIKKILITLDLTEEVIDTAVVDGIDMIITHHPIIFEKMNRITNKTILGRKIMRLIKRDIAVYTMHTNLDAAKDGLNDFLLKKLGVNSWQVIDKNFIEIYKLSIYLSKDNFVDMIKIVNECEYIEIESTENISHTFVCDERNRHDSELILKDANKIEVRGEKNNLLNVISAIEHKMHGVNFSYELIKLENKIDLGSGIGRIYDLGKEVSLDDYCNFVKDNLELDGIKVVYNSNKTVRKIGLINGSGMSYMKNLIGKVDLLITSDVKYHDALDAYENDLAIVDIGHYESEHFFGSLIVDELKEFEDIKITEFNIEAVLKYR